MLLKALCRNALFLGGLTASDSHTPAFFVRVEIRGPASRPVAFRAVSPQSAFRELDLPRMNQDARDTGRAGRRPLTTRFRARRPSPDTVRATTPAVYLVDMLAAPVHFVVSGADSLHLTVRREPGGAVVVARWGRALTLARDGHAIALRGTDAQ